MKNLRNFLLSSGLMPNSGEILWAQVAERGQQLRISLSPRSRHQDMTVKYVPEIIFQSSDNQAQLLSRKAVNIAYQTLTAGSVLFSFPSDSFNNHTQAYKAIQADFGSVEGFQPLSGFTSNPNKSNMLIE
ncbi:hypothetical protein BD560DRAFT_359727 [Blakeslea trispora]|nr:hypothetical protein BD560DRAFT_359727 [Blakeslea trispora]